MVQVLKTKTKIKRKYFPLCFVTLSSKIKMLILRALKLTIFYFMTKHMFYYEDLICLLYDGFFSLILLSFVLYLKGFILHQSAK